MNEQNFSNQAEFEPLPNRAIVYRALLRKQWRDEDTRLVESEAYYLRKNPNKQGLSVNIAAHCSPEQCAARFRTCYGVACLEVGGIRGLGLDVIPDSIAVLNLGDVCPMGNNYELRITSYELTL
ncbi:MAG TPA: hypothetical protein DD001_00820 [Microcoleaceae bacterium UBA10368]|jgi:hypothetical protein|nr:hypothetical protein [Microcoleaceae cyanobacterium UBA10368]HCV32384.1 hypothetical protein [Microcoleaceae cyanobacterium UBA9251]